MADSTITLASPMQWNREHGTLTISHPYLFSVRANGQEWCPENHKEPDRGLRDRGMLVRGEALVTLETWEGIYHLSVSCPSPGPSI